MQVSFVGPLGLPGGLLRRFLPLECRPQVLSGRRSQQGPHLGCHACSPLQPAASDSALGHAVKAGTAQKIPRARAQGKAMVDVGFWGGLVPANAHSPATLRKMLKCGALGFKAFLPPSGAPPRSLQPGAPTRGSVPPTTTNPSPRQSLMEPCEPFPGSISTESEKLPLRPDAACNQMPHEVRLPENGVAR